MLLDPKSSEALTYTSPSTTEAIDDDRSEETIDITPGEGLVSRIEMTRQAMEISVWFFNVADNNFKTLEEFTLEETDNIHKELEERQRIEFEMKEAITSLDASHGSVRTIDESITQAESLTDFRHKKPDRARGEEMRGSHDHGGGDLTEGEEQRPHPKKHDTYKSDGKKFVRHGDTEIKIEVAKTGGCYICGEPHSFESNPKEYGAQYVDHMINGRSSRAMVDTGEEANIITKTAAKRLGLSYNPSTFKLKMINAPPTPASGFMQGCHAVINPYLQQLVVMEQGGTCMVPLVKEPPRLLDPRKKVDHKKVLKEIKNKLKELRKVIYRVNKLLVVDAQDSDAYIAVMQRGVASICRGEFHVPPILSKILHPDRGEKV
ncbi:hypothetical protein EJD97_011267 [Solanum chilense]|uniref:Uncharacterized protein n=1 Tax=Solanum chilense TaxID=4083 RepID=A0A6N2AHJ7_SOLCI|nr:hypothetical protein EJD97_011267 [Solanum chilense]